MEHMITNSALGLLFLGGVSYGTWKTSMSFYREKPTEKGTQDSSLRYHKNIYLVIVSSFGIEPLVSLEGVSFVTHNEPLSHLSLCR